MTVVERERAAPVAPVVREEPDELVGVLTRAKAMVEAGWCQGDYKNPRGEVCMVGAVMYSIAPPGAWGWRLATLAESAEGYLARVVGEVTSWNDSQGRTKGEVLAAFDEAIKLRREEL